MRWKEGLRDMALWTAETMDLLSRAGFVEKSEFPTTPADEGGVGFALTDETVRGIWAIYREVVDDGEPPKLTDRFSFWGKRGVFEPVIESCLIFATRKAPGVPASTLFRFGLVLGVMVVHEEEFEGAFE